MARLARLAIANHLHHVVQSGHNSMEIFGDDSDRQELAVVLDASARRAGVAIHAWVWLPDRFHLLVTPISADALPRMMQAVGRDYVRLYNKRHGRTGTLWSGRYRSSVLEAATYALPCMVFMDLQPVNCGLVDASSDYPWSSYRYFAGIHPTPYVHLASLSSHPAVWELGNTPFAREAAYRERVNQAFGAEKFDSLVAAVQGGWALGTPSFVAEIQRLTGRRVSKDRPGRPAKSRAAT